MTAERLSPQSLIRAGVLSIKGCTASSIRPGIFEFQNCLSERPLADSSFLFLSARNCGPGIKIKEAGQNALGGMFFDNLLCPIII